MKRSPSSKSRNVKSRMSLSPWSRQPRLAVRTQASSSIATAIVCSGSALDRRVKRPTARRVMAAPELADVSETPDMHGAYPRLTEEQIEALLPRGERRRTRVGDILFREGADSNELFV